VHYAHSQFLCSLASFKLSTRVSAITAAYLLWWKAIDETFAQPGVFAVVNCPVVALSVFYSTALMRSLICLRLWTALT